MKKAWNKASRVISALLVLGMFASVVPAQALAVDEPTGQVEQQDEEQTDSDKEQTGSDEEQTGADKEQTGSDEEQAGSDKEQTGSDEEQAGTDKEQTGSDEEQTGSDEEQTGSDEEQTGSDEKENASEEEAPVESAPRMVMSNGLGLQQDERFLGWDHDWGCKPETNKLYTITNKGDVDAYYVYAYRYYDLFGEHAYVDSRPLAAGKSFTTNVAFDNISTLMVFFEEPEGYTSTVEFSTEAEGKVQPLDENFPTHPAENNLLGYDFTKEIQKAQKDGYNKGFYYTYWSKYPFECGERWFKISLTQDETTDPNPDPGPQTYTLTYYANNDTDASEIDTKTADETFTVWDIDDTDWTYEGHTFTGWNTEKNGSGMAYEADDSITADGSVTELYAQWKEDEQPLPTEVGYTINYYKDTTDSSNLLGTETGSGNIGDPIKYTSGEFLPTGYTTSNMKVSGATTISADETENVLNVVYGRRTDLSYTVYYIEDQTGRTLAGPDTVGGQTYGADITVWAKDIPGYTLTSDKNPQVVNIGTGENTIRFLYKEVGPDQTVVTPSDTTTTPAAPAAPVTPRITTPAAGGTGTAGTTGPTVTAAPADGDGDNAAEEPEEEVVPEEETPQAQEPADESIADEETPLAGSTASGWALLNLILAILTVIGAVVLVVGYFAGYQNIWRLLSLIPAIGGVVAFFMTEDMSQPMAFVDGWTVLMVIIAVVQIVVAVLALKNKDEDEDENA